MFQLLIKMKYSSTTHYVGVCDSTSITNLFNYYHEKKSTFTSLPQANLLGCLIINTETDVIVGQIYEPDTQ